MNDALERINDLIKAMEGGSYNAAPGQLVQGGALQTEDLSNTMHTVTFSEEHIKLQKMLKVETCKSTLAQFDRQLSYGEFGGSAQLEGHIGQEETSDFVRVVVPMCFYSHVRRVTIVANLVDTVDGVKAEERAASDAALKLAGDIEFDCFRGLSDFSNAGVFDGNPNTTPALPNMHGLGLQIRQSDTQYQAKDLMFSEFGSDDTVVLSAGGNLAQEMLEDAALRSSLNFGSADRLIVDPTVKSAYNKLAYGKERIILAGSPQESTGADLRKQFVSTGTVTVESSQFLRGKSKAARARSNGPLAPTSIATSVPNTSTTDAAAPTAFLANQVYIYAVTTCNEVGESPKTNTYSVTIATSADKVALTITHAATTNRYFNVYRTAPGGAAGTEKFIGRVKASTPGSGTTVFTDLGNKLPGFVTGYLLDKGENLALKELAPYSRLKLAVTELSQPEAFYRFVSLAVKEPRKLVLVDNLI